MQNDKMTLRVTVRRIYDQLEQQKVLTRRGDVKNLGDSLLSWKTKGVFRAYKWAPERTKGCCDSADEGQVLSSAYSAEDARFDPVRRESSRPKKAPKGGSFGIICNHYQSLSNCRVASTDKVNFFDETSLQ